MDIADVLRFFFYLWLLVAIVYWIRRAYIRFTRGAADDLAERATVGTPEGADSSSRSAASAKASGRRTMREVLDQQEAAKRPDPKAQSGGLVDAVIKEEIAARKAREAGGEQPAVDAGATSDSTSGRTTGRAAGGTDEAAGETSERRGLFAAATEPSAPDERAAVSALLEGMDMPCDLVPLINADTTPTPHHVVFVSTGHAPAAIGAALGDELERLGFTLRSESDTEVVALRDGDRLRVILHPDAATERADGERRFPTVPGGSVAVEFLS